MHCRLCSGDYVYAYLHNDDAPEIANPDTGSVEKLQSDSGNVCLQSSALMDVDVRHSVTEERSSEVNIPAKKARTVKKCTAAKDTAAAAVKLDDEFRHVEGAASNASSRWTLLRDSSSACSSQVSTCSTNEASDSQSSSRVQTDIGKEDFLLRPGSFRVLLCVDNQEFYGKYVCVYVTRTLCLCLSLDTCKNRNLLLTCCLYESLLKFWLNVRRGVHNKEMLIKELDRLGVNYDVRRLQVGDFLWIAQHISGATIGVMVFQFNLMRFD